MFYILKGRYGRRAMTSESNDWAQVLQQLTQSQPDEDLTKTQLERFYYKQLPYLFSGELKKATLNADNIVTRDALMITIQAHPSIKSFDELNQKVQGVWGGFEYFLYASGMTYRQGVQGIAIIPLSKPTNDSELYQMVGSWLSKLLLKEHIIARMPALNHLWTTSAPVPVQINTRLAYGVEDETIYHHEAYHAKGKPTPRLDIARPEFRKELRLYQASDVTAPHPLKTNGEFDPKKASSKDVIEAFLVELGDWITDTTNFLACLGAIKRAELRGQINHDEAVEDAKLLANHNAKWEAQNAQMYEQLQIAGTPLQSGPGMEFFFTKAQPAREFDWLDQTPNGKFKVNYDRLGTEIIHNLHYIHGKTLRLSPSAVFVNGHWLFNSAEGRMQEEVHRMLVSAYPLIDWTSHDQLSTEMSIHTVDNLDSETDPFFDPAPYLIQFQNGTLNLRTWEFGPSKAENYLIHTIPYDYDPESKPTKNMLAFQWIKALMDGDETAALHFCAFVGMCFTQTYDRQEMLMLAGSGGNGKSTLLRYITSLFESNDVVDFSLRDIDGSRFMASTLMGVHLAITSESPSDYLKSTDTLKKITGNEGKISMEKKGRDSVSLKSYAGIICAANDLPTFRDHSDGLARRLVLMPMDVDLRDTAAQRRFNEQYPQDKIEAERADFIKFCLHLFWCSILAPKDKFHDYFKLDDKMQKHVQEWLDQGDSVKAFLEGWCYISSDTSVGETKEDLYSLYVYSCRSFEGQQPLGSQRFIKRLLQCANLPKENNTRFTMGQLRKQRIRQICFTKETIDRINNNTNTHDPTEPRLPGYTHPHERLFGYECDKTQKPTN